MRFGVCCSIGIKAIVAPSFGEIFYSNAMNNLLLLAPVPQAAADGLLLDVVNPVTNWVTIDIQEHTIRSRNHGCLQSFTPAPAAVCRGPRHDRRFTLRETCHRCI